MAVAALLGITMALSMLFDQKSSSDSIEPVITNKNPNGNVR